VSSGHSLSHVGARDEAECPDMLPVCFYGGMARQMSCNKVLRAVSVCTRPGIYTNGPTSTAEHGNPLQLGESYVTIYEGESVNRSQMEEIQL
jgi:hypothetical protein